VRGNFICGSRTFFHEDAKSTKTSSYRMVVVIFVIFVVFVLRDKP